MDTRVQKLDNEPIIIVTIDADFSIREDGEAMNEVVLALLDAQPTPIFLIMDLREMKIDLEDMIFGANQAARQLHLFKHKNVRERILITASRVITLSAQGMQSPIFGGIEMKVFKTLDEALAYARDMAGS